MIVGGAVLFGLTGCAGQIPAPSDSPDGPTSIEVVSQPEHVGEPIDLDLPLHSSEAFEFERWPSACDLAEDPLIQEILPDVVEVGQTAAPVQLSILTIGEGTQTFTVPEGRCSISAGFDIDGMRLSDGNVVVDFTTQVLHAGSAKFIERNRDVSLSSGDEVQIGEATCSADGDLYVCALENIVFSIQIDARPYEQYAHTGGSIYTVDGKEIDYSEDTEAFLSMAHEKILLPVVTTAVERLSV